MCLAGLLWGGGASKTRTLTGSQGLDWRDHPDTGVGTPRSYRSTSTTWTLDISATVQLRRRQSQMPTPAHDFLSRVAGERFPQFRAGRARALEFAPLRVHAAMPFFSSTDSSSHPRLRFACASKVVLGGMYDAV